MLWGLADFVSQCSLPVFNDLVGDLSDSIFDPHRRLGSFGIIGFAEGVDAFLLLQVIDLGKFFFGAGSINGKRSSAKAVY